MFDLRLQRLRIAALWWMLATTACAQQPGPSPGVVDQPELRQQLATTPGATWERPPETGVVREYELVAAPTRLQLIDGRELAVWAYNGQVPGPTLRAEVGDRLRVRLVNRLPQATSIHWHGLRLDNHMDGVPGVTQPPIEPGESFTYEFVVEDAGTFWFHPHIRGSEQIERGLHAALIVGDGSPSDLREEVWVLDDWRLTQAGELDSHFVTRHDLAHDGRWGQALTINGVSGTTLAMRPGERVRLRLINVANGRVFRPRFDGLTAKVVAFDGRPTSQPLAIDTLELAPGNRADIELTAPTSGRWFVVEDTFMRRRLPLATIDVRGPAVPASASANDSSAATLPDPDWSDAARLRPDQTLRLQARRGGPFGVEWTINDEIMRHDEHEHASVQHEPRYVLQDGRFTRLQFVNESARLHPMHLHGQFFRVLARDGVPIEEHHWRDTVLVRPYEVIDIGLVPRDAGLWTMHCHIQEHHDSGMMTLLRVDEAHLAGRNGPGGGAGGGGGTVESAFALLGAD